MKKTTKDFMKTQLSVIHKTGVAKTMNENDRLAGIRGFLIVYLFLLSAQLIHGLVLTGGSIVLYNNPSLAATQGFSLPLSGMLLYDITNLILAADAILVLVLMLKKKKAAIINGVILSVLWPLALLIWHMAGEKSNFGTVVDSLPNVLGILYLLLSRRVKATFVH